MKSGLRSVLTLSLVSGALAAHGCTDSPIPEPATGFEIAVAPLSLPGIEDVCYAIEVRNDAGQTVWFREHVCSSQYGDGVGDVTYIGPCDAQDSDASGDARNTVTLTIENLYTAAVDPGDYTAGVVPDGDWVNPCGVDADGADLATNADGHGPCQITAPCVENRDTPVVFNVTVLRNADQGFFDVAVNFEDIFCSSKLDTCDTDGRAIELLFDPTGQRGQTAVLALACTSGPGAGGDTVLHLNPIVVRCDGGVEVALDPTAGPGNAWDTANPDPDPTDPIWQYAVYRGAEALECGAGSCQKLYWNVAIGFDPAAPNCRVYATATASSAARMTDGLTPAHTTYPIIHFGADQAGE